MIGEIWMVKNWQHTSLLEGLDEFLASVPVALNCSLVQQKELGLVGSGHLQEQIPPAVRIQWSIGFVKVDAHVCDVVFKAKAPHSLLVPTIIQEGITLLFLDCFLYKSENMKCIS